MPELQANDELIREHYRKIALKDGASPRSTMEDDHVREKELEWIISYRNLIRRQHGHSLHVLDLGCGNGYALEQLSSSGSDDRLSGVDFSADLLEIANGRGLKGCSVSQGDARELAFDDATFDFVYTERCLINILDEQEQIRALNEIARVLKPGGDYLMIECFTDGLENNNKARVDCGLAPLKAAYHNRYFDKDVFHAAIRGKFKALEAADLDAAAFQHRSNFLSSYYFISRVLYPASVHGGEVVRNSEMAKFFSFLPPVGNYSPIQAYVLRKI